MMGNVSVWNKGNRTGVFFVAFAMSIIFASCRPSLPDEVAQAYENLPDKVDFNFHIRAILSDRCFACHGPDQNTREAELRLDLEPSAFAELKISGGHAFVKGNLGKSQAWQRIISGDPEIRMPPTASNMSLTDREKALIAKWIRQGAEWKEHWSFIPPEKPEVPESGEEKPGNAIDPFILANMKDIGLTPSPEADKVRLIRRLSFDLRGLPPTIPEIEDYLQDDSPDAYEKLVDQFLETDAYAERMALEWMDVARYADSHGLHADGMREMWPWRDWVIRAFKDNLPYNDFVSRQIAGDLIPGAGREQKLATAFHRNHPINSEAGIVSEEFRVKYVADRVNTTATAFLGLTMECATCHDHKFDPISQKEYYQMASFFNNIKELGMIGNDKNFGPILLLPEPEQEQKLARLDSAIKEVSQQLELATPEIASISDFIAKIKSNDIKGPTPAEIFPFDSFTESVKKNGQTEQVLDHNPAAVAVGTPELVAGKIGKAVRLDSDYDRIFLDKIKHFNLSEPFSAGGWVKVEKSGTFQTIMGNIGGKNSGWRGWVFFLDSLNRPAVKIVHSLSHNYLHVLSDVSVKEGEWNHIFFTYDGSAQAKGLHLYLNGRPVEMTVLYDKLYKSIEPVRERTYIPDPGRKVKMGIGNIYLYTDTDDGVLKGALDQVQFFYQYLTPLEVEAVYRREAASDTPPRSFAREEYFDHFLWRTDPAVPLLQKQLSELKTEKFDLLDEVREIMVLEEMPAPRKTYILDRGRYDVLGEEVSANTPEAVLPFSDRFPRNRLGLAQWLFDDRNPLTARVAVNRYWQMIFGRGIVETPHDFGSQGALPTHPELLDYLAVTFRESGWDVKALLKLMVTSATYRQSSVNKKEHLQKDPENKYLARGPSFRLPAEMIRDNALFVSGLLNKNVGGESVKPYQPGGLWEEKNEFSGFLKTYQPDTGEKLYRKSLYTFIRRTSPPPAMATFDAPAREVCTVKREKTNTPMQALVLLNDPQFVEAARVLAAKLQTEAGDDIESSCFHAFRLLCGRLPTKQEEQLIKKQFQLALKRFEQSPRAADELLGVGEAPLNSGADKIRTAALTMVVNTIMNFDEFYMRR